MPYQVLDVDGHVAAEGVIDGDPVTLPAGVYTVEVLSEPGLTIEHVIIGGEEELVVQLGE